MNMKKTFLLLFCILASFMANAEIRVLSDTKLGEGFFPRFVDAETVVYLTNSNADYRTADDEATLRVDNENLNLNLYRNGEHIVRALELDPNLAEAYYNRGLTHIFLGNNRQGVQDLSKAGELGLYSAYNIIKRFTERTE